MTNDELDRLTSAERDVLARKLAAECEAAARARGGLWGIVGVREIDLYVCDVCGAPADQIIDHDGMKVYLCDTWPPRRSGICQGLGLSAIQREAP